MAQYGKLEYWNERYTKEKDPFDWYQRYSGIKHLMKPSILSPNIPLPTNDALRVLVPGCGNSLMMEDMKDDGFNNITCIDFSPVVISQMEKKYKDQGMIFKVVDVTKSIPYPDSSYDLIVCKGTLDAILCSSGASGNARIFLEECSRVLDEEHGVLVIVTYGNQENRMVYIEDEKVWEGGVEVHEVPKPRINTPSVNEKGDGNHYVYICRKKKHIDELREQMEDLKVNEENEQDRSEISDPNKAIL